MFEISRDGDLMSAMTCGLGGLNLYDIVSGGALCSILSDGYGMATEMAVHPLREGLYTCGSDGEVLY